MSRAIALLFALVVVTAAVPGVAVAAHDTSTSTADCSFPLTRTDATGTSVTLSSAPDSIVTLSPSAAQTLWELGLSDRVVGISEFARYLDGTSDLPVVNTVSGGINVERVVALQPDLVLAPGTISAETVANLRQKGLTVFALESPASIEGVAEKTTLIGRLTGACTAAAETNAWMRANVESVRTALADADRPRAMYVFSGGYTVGTETFIHDVMTTAGTQNVMAAAGIEGYAQVSPEIVRKQDPEWFVLNSREDSVPSGAAYQQTTAAKRNQVVVVDVNYLNQPAPRSIVHSVRNITEVIHPDAYEGAEYVSRADVEQTPTETETETPTETATPPTESSGPGFGAVAGVLALVAAVLLIRRPFRR